MVIATHILLLQLFEQLSFYSKMASALHTHFYFTYKAQMSQVLNFSNKPFQLTLISTRSENIYVYVQCDIQRYSTGNIVLSTELFFAHSTRKTEVKFFNQMCPFVCHSYNGAKLKQVLIEYRYYQVLKSMQYTSSCNIVHSWTAMAVTTYNYNKYTPINVK